MRNVLFVLIALIAGLVGGAIGTYAVLTHERNRPEALIRAQRFELVNESGEIRSFWGVNELGHIELAFGTPKVRPEGNSPQVSSGFSKGSRGPDAITPRLEIGLMNQGGEFLSFIGSDHQLRFLLDVDDFERPSLMMSDAGVMRLTLGSVRSDTPDYRDRDEHWALRFYPEDTADIGVNTAHKAATITANGFLWINPKPVPVAGLEK